MSYWPLIVGAVLGIVLGCIASYHDDYPETIEDVLWMDR